jgi:hypothetical protein
MVTGHTVLCGFVILSVQDCTSNQAMPTLFQILLAIRDHLFICLTVQYPCVMYHHQSTQDSNILYNFRMLFVQCMAVQLLSTKWS